MAMNATDIACPVCGAKPGEKCHTLTGKWLPVTHSRRKWAVLDQHLDREDGNQNTTPALERPIKE